MKNLEPIAETPVPPYYSVIFTSRVKIEEGADNGADYASTANRMLELAAQQEGFLGVETVRDSNGVGITVSYWRDLEEIRKWHDVAEHKAAQSLGYSKWYDRFCVSICRVERAYEFDRRIGQK